MTVDESIETLKTAAEVFERLRVGLVPFVKDTVVQERPYFTPEELAPLCYPSKSDDSDVGTKSLPEMPDTFAGMDILAILHLMDYHKDKLHFMDAFQRELGEGFKGTRGTLYRYRNRAAHHSDLVKARDGTFEVNDRFIPDLPRVIGGAFSWLKAIADRYPGRYPDAEAQLAPLKALQSKNKQTPKSRPAGKRNRSKPVNPVITPEVKNILMSQ